MKLNLVGILLRNSQYFDAIFNDGTSAYTHTCELFYSLHQNKISSIQECSCTLLTVTGNKRFSVPDEFERIEISDNVRALVEALLSLAQTHEQTEFCITWLDSVFQHEELYRRLLALHHTYRAHYTYAEGYPVGVSPVCISQEGMELIHAVQHGYDEFAHRSIERDSLFRIVEKKIHDFDIETDLAKEDMRMHRLELCADTRRNFIISKRLWEAGMRNVDDLNAYYSKQPETFIGPAAYIYLQISNHNDACIYTPYPVITQDEAKYMDTTLFRQIVKKARHHSPEAVISLGLAGETATHPQIGALLREASEHFATVYVETMGRDWQTESWWWDEEWLQNITWIVFLDALDATLYSQIHPTHFNQSALSFLNFLSQKTEKRKIYLQCTRMKQNEEEIANVAQLCKEKGYQLLVQKYNSYCGHLEDRKVVDLSPPHRFPCRHLARDLLVTMQGDVALCTQDIDQQHNLGNITEHSIEEILLKKEQLFVEQVKNNYREICVHCDEYYTANA